MIMCESGECEIEWFHIDCLRITTIPKDKWRCPDCKKSLTLVLSITTNCSCYIIN